MSIDNTFGDCLYEDRDSLNEECPDPEGYDANTSALNSFIFDLALDDLRLQLQSARLFADVELVILLYASLAFLLLFLFTSPY